MNNYLQHYGVKGMKWGVRKDRKGKKPKKEISTAKYRKQALARRRTLKQKDLDDLVKRLEQEKKLKNLLEEDLNPGKKFAKQVMSSTGAKVAGVVATGVAVTVIGRVLTTQWVNSDKPIAKAVQGFAKELHTNIPKIRK